MHGFTIDLTAPGARERFHAMQLRSALRLYAKSGMLVTRGASPKRLLALVTNYTGKRYANSAKGHAAAIADLDLAIDGAPSV
jgi:hypothetical protein